MRRTARGVALVAVLAVAVLAVAALGLVAVAQARNPADDPNQKDLRFDNRELFQLPWLEPFDLNMFLPRTETVPGWSFGTSWLGAPDHQKRDFLIGFGDMLVFCCLERFGNTAKAGACARPLLPLPPEPIIAAMDTIYRDRRFTGKSYDLVFQAAMRKLSGEDWQGFLTASK